MNEILPQIQFYGNALWQRRWLALSIGWAMCIVGWIFVAMIPNVYQSSGRIFVDQASFLRPLLSGLAIDNDIRNQVEIMKRTLLSRPNMLEVARVTDLDVTAKSEAALFNLVSKLQDGTTIATTATNLFKITYTGEDPVIARDIVQALITIFIERNLGDSRTDMETARAFLERQIQAYETQLLAAEQRAAKFKQENLVLLPGQYGYYSRLEKTRAMAEAIQSEIKAAKIERGQTAQEMAAVSQYVQKPTGEGPPLGNELRIIELEAELERLLVSYTEQHPDVIAVRRSLERLVAQDDAVQPEARSLDGEAVAANGEASNGSAYQTPNPFYEILRSRLLDQDSRILVLLSRAEDIKAKMIELESLTAAVPLVEAELAKLNRNYGVLQSKYSELLNRREAAKISQDREEQADKVQYRIVEPPTVPAYPSGPQRQLFFLAATLAGLGSGVGTAILLVVLNTTYATAARLSKEFGIPVAGSIIRLADIRATALETPEPGGFRDLPTGGSRGAHDHHARSSEVSGSARSCGPASAAMR